MIFICLRLYFLYCTVGGYFRFEVENRRFLRDDPPDFNHGTVGVINMMHTLKEGRDESDFYR